MSTAPRVWRIGAVEGVVYAPGDSTDRWLHGGLAALLGAWLLYTRFFATLSRSHLVLPACPFLLITGHPCPFCGGTRSYAATWDGNLGVAFRLYPFGPLLFLMTFALIAYALWVAVTGRRVFVFLSRRREAGLAGLVAGALLMSWMLKLFWLGN